MSHRRLICGLTFALCLGAGCGDPATALDAGGADGGALDAALFDASPFDDAGAIDAAPFDGGGGPPDAGAPDADPPDARAPDAGPPDAGPPDAGPPDAGPPDAGPPDADPPDAGPPDAGPPDAGPPDAGPPDAGPPDAGPPADPCTPLPSGLTTWTRSDSASSGTPDTYVLNVTPGDPFCASITGGGSGRWWVNVSNGTSTGVYCRDRATCSILVPPGQTALMVTAVTDAIGSYTLTVRYRPR